MPRWPDLTGVPANAVLGGMIARSARLDPQEFVILASVSGVGGGVIRDVLLQHGTPVAPTGYAYLLTVSAGAGIALVLRVEGRVRDMAWLFVDALAPGCGCAADAGDRAGLAARGAAGCDHGCRRRFRARGRAPAQPGTPRWQHVVRGVMVGSTAGDT